MSNKRILKAYERYDYNGRVVPGSLVLRNKIPKNGKWKEVPAYECCNDIIPQAFRLLFSNISEVDAIVGDSTNVADWNTYFDLPTYGSPFTSVEVVGDEVRLFGGSNIIIKESLFDQADELGTFLLEVDDDAGCIIEVEYDGFGYEYNEGCRNLVYINLPSVTVAGTYAFNFAGNLASSPLVVNLPLITTAGYRCFSHSNLTTIDLPVLATAGQECFVSCFSLTTISFPQLQTAGANCFTYSTSLTTIALPSCTNLGGTVGNNGVFGAITGNTITLTVPSALMTCNGGLPDGDIVYLQANNTVTIITV